MNPLADSNVWAIFSWIALIICLTVPFFFSGVLVSLFLTRSPYRVGWVYGIDMAGAAFGCIAALLVLDLAGWPTALIWIALAVAVSSLLFAHYRGGVETSFDGPRGSFFHVPIITTLAIAAVLGLITQGKMTIRVGYPSGTSEADRGEILFEGWNSFSGVALFEAWKGPPLLWGVGQSFELEKDVTQRITIIDGTAGTYGYAFSGDWSELSFLDYDVSNLAYQLPGLTDGAVIGAGAGRDLLSAKRFGLRNVVGIELNPLIAEILTERRDSAGSSDFASFSNIDRIEGVRIEVDEARSWLARTQERFDIIQMSLIDTWAATGAGAYVLSENRLYTREAWTIFLGRLRESGVLTVSRLYYPNSADHTVRLTTLAMAALWAVGVRSPAEHIFLATSTPPFSSASALRNRVATLVVARRPLEPAAITALEEACARFGFQVLMSPTAPPSDPNLRLMIGSETPLELDRAVAKLLPVDVSPPTDRRPFFFNQLPVFKLATLVNLKNQKNLNRDQYGNLIAFATFYLLLAISLVMVVVMILVPAWSATRKVAPRLVFGGTSYFLLIGTGFMFVEIGFLQLWSVFLGHPVYSLSIVLFSLILSTAAGSFCVDRYPLHGPKAFFAVFLLLSGYLFSMSFWLPDLLLEYEHLTLIWRATICIVAIAPSGFVMGFALPTGMSLVAAKDQRPTPWFWGINGAAAVVASTVSIGLSLTFGIYATLACGAACYLALGASAVVIGFRREGAMDVGNFEHAT